MKKIIIFLLWIIFCSNSGATTYFVATNGNDSNNGTNKNSPLLTVAKAISLVSAGDHVQVRGGIYYFSSTISISISGTQTDSCFLFSYPGERAILDFSGNAKGMAGINLSGSYWHIKGLDIRKAGKDGMYINTGGNNVIEFCSFYENNFVGLRLSSGAHDNKIINCDAYFNADPPRYGNADGFQCGTSPGSNNYFFGCRSWLNTDDGFDGYLRGTDDVSTVYINCWAWLNGYLKDGTDAGREANGNGFKTGGSDEPRKLMHNATLKNCVAFDNKATGFDQNSNDGTMILYNCTAYRNKSNFGFGQSIGTGKSIEIKNCVAVDGKVTIADFAKQETNSWMSPFLITPDDFISLDTTGITGPRKADGSMPDLKFVHPARGSDLIDKGTNVGIPYTGKAPDLGAYEFNLTPDR